MSTEWLYTKSSLGGYIVYEDWDKPICAVNDEEHARMIAAAPKMLEALEYVATIAHEGGLIGLHEANAMIAIRKLSMQWWNLSRSKSESIEALNNAIAKAKGETP